MFTHRFILPRRIVLPGGTNFTPAFINRQEADSQPGLRFVLF